MTAKNLYYYILEQGYTQEELDRVLNILTAAGTEPAMKNPPPIRSTNMTMNNNPLDITPGDSPAANR